MLNLDLILRLNDYQTYKAQNGVEALKLLETMDNPPDLILSDIMMPEMDGYDFFEKVSDNPNWFRIPFIFLTAKSDPEDVRFGKKLGVDDYIIKPFDNDDLLASIKGKLRRNKFQSTYSQKIGQKILDLLIKNLKPSLMKGEKEELVILIIDWDESFGPKITTIFPEKVDSSIDFDIIGTQLFQATVSVYGQTTDYDPQGLLLRIASINKDGYIYFDAIDDDEVRGGKRQFMLVALAPRINYLESLRIEEEFTELARNIRNGIEWKIEPYWKRMVEILMTDLIQS